MSAEEQVEPHDDESLLDIDLVKHQLQWVIGEVQAEIQYTTDDTTRIRQKAMLKKLQRLAAHFEAQK